jgi:DNA-binding GntR family transcriptional regulator
VRLVHRYDALIEAAGRGENAAEMTAEMDFHSLPCEFSDDSLLLATWRHVARRMQVGFILHRAAPDSPDSVSMHEMYLALALGNDLDRMLAEVDSHIDLGLETMRAMFKKLQRAGTGG